MYFIVVTSSSSGTRRCYIVVWRTIHEKYYQLVSTGRRQRPGRKKITIFFSFTLLYSHYFFFLSDPSAAWPVRDFITTICSWHRAVLAATLHIPRRWWIIILYCTHAHSRTQVHKQAYLFVCVLKIIIIFKQQAANEHTHIMYIYDDDAHTHSAHNGHIVLYHSVTYYIYIRIYVCIYIQGI